MAAIILPRKHYTQPQGRVELLPSYDPHALLAYYGNSSNVISRRHGSMQRLADRASPFSPPASLSALGIGENNSTTNTAVMFYTNDSSEFLCEFAPASDMTFCFAIDNLNATSGNPGFFRSGNNSTGSTFLLQNGSNRRPWFRVDGSDVLIPGSGAQWVYGQPLFLVARFRSGSYIDVWWSGRRQHFATTAVNTPNLLSTDGILAFGAQLSTRTERMTGNWLSVCAFNHFMDDGFAESFSSNPWSIFRADPHRIYSLPPVITIPALSNPGVIDIGTTSARPQVTLTY